MEVPSRRTDQWKKQIKGYSAREDLEFCDQNNLRLNINRVKGEAQCEVNTLNLGCLQPEKMNTTRITIEKIALVGNT